MPGYFTIDIITDVFSRLPAKSLMRFKCVSKEIRSLIEDPIFIKFHLNKSRQSGNNIKLVFLEKLSMHQGIPLIYCCDLFPINLNAVQDTFSLPIHHAHTLVGCCDGMICLMDYKDNIIIVNIFTREHRIVVDTCLDKDEHCFGFGYDSINDDYKFVIIRCLPTEFDYEARVYSLKNRTWKTIGLFTKPYEFSWGSAKNEISLAGSLHGLAAGNRGKLIVAFDLGTDSFHEIEMPGRFHEFNTNALFSELSVFGGLLCVTHFSYTDTGDFTDIWFMEEYKVKESWTKRFSIRGGIFQLYSLVWYKEGDTILMQDELHNVFWIDTVKTQIKFFNNKKHPRVGVAGVCTESLVRLR